MFFLDEASKLLNFLAYFYFNALSIKGIEDITFFLFFILEVETNKDSVCYVIDNVIILMFFWENTVKIKGYMSSTILKQAFYLNLKI